MTSIPESWDRSVIGELFEVQLGKMLNKAAKSGANPQPYLTNFNVKWGEFDLSRLNKMAFNEKEKEKFLLQEGDLLVCEGGEIGRCAIWNNQVSPCYYQKALHRLRPLSEDIVPEYMQLYLEYFIQSSLITNFVSRTSIAHLTRENLLEFPVTYPAKSVQKNIVGLIYKWQKYINLLKSIIENKKKFKRGLEQQLLSGKRRLSKYKIGTKYSDKHGTRLPTDWTYPMIEDIASDISVKNTNGNSFPVLSCTKHHGLVDSLSYFGKQVFSKDTSTYKVVSRGQFAYATNHIEEGSIGYQDLYEHAVISPMYTVFEANDTVDDRFLFLLLKTERYRRIFESRTSASVNRRGSLRWKEFSKIHIPLPPVKEQKAIVATLDIFEREIGLLKNKLEAINQQKQGLMQQLLTGKIPVNTKRK